MNNNTAAVYYVFLFSREDETILDTFVETVSNIQGLGRAFPMATVDKHLLLQGDSTIRRFFNFHGALTDWSTFSPVHPMHHKNS